MVDKQNLQLAITIDQNLKTGEALDATSGVLLAYTCVDDQGVRIEASSNARLRDVLSYCQLLVGGFYACDTAKNLLVHDGGCFGSAVRIRTVYALAVAFVGATVVGTELGSSLSVCP